MRSRDQKSELYGRALVVLAAERYAARLVLPASKPVPATRWASHTDHAAKGAAEASPARTCPHRSRNWSRPSHAPTAPSTRAKPHAEEARKAATGQADVDADDAALGEQPDVEQALELDEDLEVDDEGWDRELGGASDGITVSDADPGL